MDKHGLELNVFQLLEIVLLVTFGQLPLIHAFQALPLAQLDLLGMEINVLLPEALTAHQGHHGMELPVFLPLFIALPDRLGAEADVHHQL